MINLTEAVRARYLIENVLSIGPRHCYPTEQATPSPEVVSTWAAIATRVAMLAMVYGAFFALKKKFSPPDKKDALVGASWLLQRKLNADEEQVCPICLEAPRSGVRAGCGHRLCARCLRSYCESHRSKRRRPPPCPLCRTPLVSVTLTYDQINLLPRDCGSDCTVDPATAKWISEYNASRGLVDEEPCFLVKLTMTLVKLLLVALFVGILARFQSSYGIDLAVYSSYFVTVFGMALMMCLWYKSKDRVEYESG